jgi:hypothetical protein
MGIPSLSFSMTRRGSLRLTGAKLWTRFSAGDTVITALQQLQKVISWELVNQDPRHVIQPAAIEWYNSPSRQWSLPLFPFSTWIQGSHSQYPQSAEAGFLDSYSMVRPCRLGPTTTLLYRRLFVEVPCPGGMTIEKRGRNIC